jgi:hypothetical protein
MGAKNLGCDSILVDGKIVPDEDVAFSKSREKNVCHPNSQGLRIESPRKHKWRYDSFCS